MQGTRNSGLTFQNNKTCIHGNGRMNGMGNSGPNLDRMPSAWITIDRWFSVPSSWVAPAGQD
jgi:hypothetical protein